jgi:hypothetical protein
MVPLLVLKRRIVTVTVVNAAARASSLVENEH